MTFSPEAGSGRCGLREAEGGGEVAAPPGRERHLADGGALDGMDHRGGRGQDGSVLGHRAAAVAEDQDIAGSGSGRRDLGEMAAGGGNQRLLAGGLAQSRE